jgi:3D (Asp-Asp-Asp) domain-containing protein
MNILRKNEMIVKGLCALFFLMGLILSVMWMAGFATDKDITYTRYESLAQQHDAGKNMLAEQNAAQSFSETRGYYLSDDLASSHYEALYWQYYVHEGMQMDNDNKSKTVAMKEHFEENEEDKKEGSITLSSLTGDLDIAFDLKRLEREIDFSQFPTKRVMATGYTAGKESTGKTKDHPLYGITFSGVQVRRDLYSTIAADLDVFPLGTLLYIPNYGFGVVADIGSAIQGNKIDLYYETVDDVFRLWGKRKVDVYIIEKGLGTVTEAMLDELNQDEAIAVYKAE